MKASEDDASQYMSIMNCIFAAQKHNVMIDACILGSNSGLLQQACDMTGGLYLKVAKEETFLQYLLVSNVFSKFSLCWFKTAVCLSSFLRNYLFETFRVEAAL